MTRKYSSAMLAQSRRSIRIAIAKRKPGWNLRKRQALDMSDVCRAWVGAMIDAEGWVGPVRPGSLAQCISLGNTEVEIISALLRATGVGRVTYQARPDVKPMYYWKLHALRDVNAIAEQIAPFSMKAQRCVKEALQRV